MGKRAVAVAALATSAALSACGSSAAPSAKQTTKGAATPKGAALGFDRSLRSGAIGVPTKFDCHPGTSALSVLAVDQGRPTASASHADAGWVVTLTYPGLSYQYGVRHRDSGYCVFMGPSPASFGGSKSAGATP